MVVKFMLIPDAHLSDIAPSTRNDTYCQDILEKLEWACQRAIAEKCAAVVQAGDLFHRKAPTSNSHALVQAVDDIFGARGVPPVYLVPGNHDLRNDRLGSLDSQPLGAVAKAKNVHLLLGQSPGFPLLWGLPWQADWRALHNLLAPWREEAGPESLLVTHAPIVPNRLEPFEVIQASFWAEEMGHKGSCFYGHLHNSHGNYELGSVNFANFGSISRGSLHRDSLEHTPTVTLWEDGAFTPVTVPHKPAEQVFRLDEHHQMQARKESLDDFLAAVEETRLETVTPESVLAHAREQGCDEQVLEEIQSCLEAVL